MNETPDIRDRIRIQALDAYTDATRAFAGLMTDLASTQRAEDRAGILQQMCELTRQRADLYTAAFGEHPTASGQDMADAVAGMAHVLAALAFTELARANGGHRVLRRCPATPVLEEAAGPVLDQLLITTDADEQFRLLTEDLHDAIAPVLGEYAAQITRAIAETLPKHQPDNQPAAPVTSCGDTASDGPNHAAKPGSWLSQELARAASDPTKVLWAVDLKSAPATGPVVHHDGSQSHLAHPAERSDADVTGPGTAGSTQPRSAIAAFFAVLGAGIALSGVLPELGWPMAAAMMIAALVAAALAGAVAGSVSIRLTNRTRQPNTTPSLEDEEAEGRDVHAYFGLTYSNYQVLPRTLLQSMPPRWQHQLVSLLDQLDDAYAHIPTAEGYKVTAGRWVYANECSPAQLKTAGVTSSDSNADSTTEPEPEPEVEVGDHPDEYETTYHDTATGQELQGHDYVFVPGVDPVPPYNRGRTHIEPHIGQLG